VGAAAVPGTLTATDDGTLEIHTPIIGTFYRAPKPGAAPFVEVGSQVGRDTVVGIVETMKLMNSVHAGATGTVVEICAANGELVEQGHVLMRYVHDFPAQAARESPRGTRRVIRTCHRLGIETVLAIQADPAGASVTPVVCISAAPSASYLHVCGHRAAVATGRAIHPGYGFLSNVRSPACRGRFPSSARPRAAHRRG
jgi:acetyl/propionyl-CoA carboxylase alpha subunit